MEGVKGMFKKLSLEEQLQKEKEEKLILLNKHIELENAMLELAAIVADQKEGEPIE